MDKIFQSVHFIGIKGVGVSAVAIVAKGLGFKVTGSDTDETFITDLPLKQAGITPCVGFSPSNIDLSVDLIVASTAYGPDNPELVEAKKRAIPVWTYSEFLGFLSKNKKTLAVAGTHGKTTTTAILAYLFYKASYSPSYVIGTGSVSGLPSHGLAGRSELFITEADDYKRSATDPSPKFLDLSPFAAIITSIEHDHPDMYPKLSDCILAFRKFVRKVDRRGFIIVNGDDPNIEKILTDLGKLQVISFGVKADVNFKIKIIDGENLDQVRFRLTGADADYGPFSFRLRGWHNLYNATAAILMAIQIGLSEENIKKLLPKFQAVERRYQLLGSVGNITVIDDYAHHPSSVRVVLETAKNQFKPRPIWCFFQSHTYTRTKVLLKEFGLAFSDANAVIVTDIFSSAREQTVTIEAKDLAKEIGKYHGHVKYVPREKLLSFMRSSLPSDAVAITMGAGDIYKIGRQFVSDSLEPVQDLVLKRKMKLFERKTRTHEET